MLTEVCGASIRTHLLAPQLAEQLCERAALNIHSHSRPNEIGSKIDWKLIEVPEQPDDALQVDLVELERHRGIDLRWFIRATRLRRQKQSNYQNGRLFHSIGSVRSTRPVSVRA